MVKIALFISFLLLQDIVLAQESNSEKAILFYNVENLFDTLNDTLANDDEFTPDGSYHWNIKRYFKKLTNINKVIYDCNEWNTPFLIGLCEIENNDVLNDLLWNGSLYQRGYRSIHYNSLDPRGIDVALIYNSKEFIPINSNYIREPTGALITRDILYVKGVADHRDTLHVFVCHFPSRRGGAIASEPKRVTMAQLLFNCIDSIVLNEVNSQILVMGDFNDTPNNKIVKEIILKPLSTQENMICLGANFANQGNGSHKYQEEWSLIDQMFINQHFAKFINYSYQFKTITLPYLLTNDEENLGQKPYRTYLGPRYVGGYSDHLPVMLTYKIKKAP